MARVLLVDDDADLRASLRVNLERRGHSVFEAEDGFQALRVYREKTPDLILTHVLMPSKDGLEVIIELRREFPDVCVIAMSGGYSPGRPEMTLDAAQALGAAFTLAKPFTPEQLDAAIASVLGTD